MNRFLSVLVLILIACVALSGCNGNQGGSGQTEYLKAPVTGSATVANSTTTAADSRDQAKAEAKAKAQAKAEAKAQAKAQAKVAEEARLQAWEDARAKAQEEREARKAKKKSDRLAANANREAAVATAATSPTPTKVRSASTKVSSSRGTKFSAAVPRVSSPKTRVSSSLRSQILALNPERISDGDIQRVLSKAPAPQVITIHGGLYPVHLLMKDFTKFLAAMGYPAKQSRLPGMNYSYSCYRSSKQIAGAAAWYYEQTGMRVLMSGHSQGGMQVMKVLHELSGSFGESSRVRPFNPEKNRFEDREVFWDPQRGREVRIEELNPVYYASGVAAGGLTQLMPNQWVLGPLTRKVPNATRYFTGYAVPGDIIGGGVQGEASAYRPTGRAIVRNVLIKWGSEHVFVPRTHYLAKNAASRAWISTWHPSLGDHRPSGFKGPTGNLLYAANIWYEFKKFWCLSVQEAVK